MKIVLRDYLNRIETAERAKPPHARQRVPSLRELAKELEIHEVNLSRLANNKVTDLRLPLAAKIIATMRQYGFPMEVTDLLVFTPDENS
jgi:DNA-binding Xre family transcriptional regulator